MAVDMFLQVKGIEGESTDDAKKGWIDVISWSWGASNSGDAHLGGGAGAGKSNVQDLTFTHYIDKASCPLMLHCLKGTHADEATLIVRKAGGTPVEYLTIKMSSKVFVTSVTTGGSGGEDRLTESVSLNFGKVEVTYKEQTDKGAGKTAGTLTYDMTKNK